TRIASGTPYYERFLERFPTVRDLAAAPFDDVLTVWEGLGFYGRARNLHVAAQAVVERHHGMIPQSYHDLMALPGIGPYTAGAVASIAFGIPVPAVDGNVIRVIARLFRIRENVTSGAVRRRITEIAGKLVSPEQPGAFNQALMELGATVCTPSAPACIRCPLERLCLARAAGEERTLPISSRPSGVRRGRSRSAGFSGRKRCGFLWCRSIVRPFRLSQDSSPSGALIISKSANKYMTPKP